MLTNNINIETFKATKGLEVLYRPYSQVWSTKKGLLATTATCRSTWILEIS